MGVDDPSNVTVPASAASVKQGRWRVGESTSMWGRFARAATLEASLRFKVDSQRFMSSGGTSAAVHLRVVYMAAKAGTQWQLQYAARSAIDAAASKFGDSISDSETESGSICMAKTLTAATGSWEEFRLDIPAGAWEGGGACDGVDLEVTAVHKNAEVAVAFIELSRDPFGFSAIHFAK